MAQTPLHDDADDSALDARIGILLRAGMFSSAAVILIGGILFLLRHGGARPDYRDFHGVPEGLGTLGGIFTGVLHGRSPAIIQFGLLMLIATPIARVAFSVLAFLVERDYMYVCFSAIVLLVLIYSLVLH